MSTRKPVSRLLSLTEFQKAHPEISKHQLYWAMRNRQKNGLKKFVYRKPCFKNILFLDESPAHAWFSGAVLA